MTTNPKTKIKFAFCGTTPLAEPVLAELAKAGLVPARTIDSGTITSQLLKELKQEKWDVFVVASFGSILPKELLDIPKRGTINVHPSLLPRLRGASPIRSAILNDDKETG